MSQANQASIRSLLARDFRLSSTEGVPLFRAHPHKKQVLLDVLAERLASAKVPTSAALELPSRIDCYLGDTVHIVGAIVTDSLVYEYSARAVWTQQLGKFRCRLHFEEAQQLATAGPALEGARSSAMAREIRRPPFVEYNGAWMIEGWPSEIEEAQKKETYFLNGKAVRRIRFGDEGLEMVGAATHCGDCRVALGQFHVPACDLEVCPACFGQALSCDCLRSD